MRGRLVQAAKRAQSVADIAVEIRSAIVARDRPADEVDSNLAVAGLMRDHAEKMQAVSMVRVDRENLTIEPLRLVEAAGLMQGQGGSQRLCDIQAHFSPLRPTPGSHASNLVTCGGDYWI